MIRLTNTTYYPAILLRKRWHEAIARQRGAFDIEQELQRLQTAEPLTSTEVNELERWSAGREAPAAGPFSIRVEPGPRRASRRPTLLV